MARLNKPRCPAYPAVHAGALLAAMIAAAPSRADVLPETYGASHSLREIACTTEMHSSRLFCPSGVGDFKRGQGIDIVGAGKPTPVPPPRGLRLRLKGSGNSGIKATYAICAADLWKGISGCLDAAAFDAPVRPNAAHHVVVQYERNLPNAAIWLLYRRIENGPWHFITTLNGHPFDDLGWTQPRSAGWPTKPPEAPVNQDFFSTVAAINGNEIILADRVPAFRSPATVRHDDVLAVQAAYDACAGGTVRFGPHHYRLVRPSVWNFTTQRYYYTYTRATPGYPDLYPQGIIHPQSHCSTIGAGRRKTFLLTDFMNTPNAGGAVFGFNAGIHASPSETELYASRVYPVADALRGARFVRLKHAADAANFAAGDFVMVKGGLPVATSESGSSEIDRVAATDERTGSIDLVVPLEKPLPFGRVGTPPAIVKLNGDIVTDVSFSHLTIETYSSAFGNSSAVYHAHLFDINVPFRSNGQLWYGGYRRDWTNRNVDLAATSGTELDLDEDFLWEGGSCHTISGNCFGGSEASANLRFRHTKLSGSNLLGTPANLLIGVQNTVNGFELIDSTLTMNCDPTASDGAVIAVQGGGLDDEVSVGFTVARNHIVTNCPKAISLWSTLTDIRIVDNVIRQEIDRSAPSSGIFAGNGSIRGNAITVIEPGGAADQYCGIGGYFGGLPKQVALSGPWTIRNNTLTVIGDRAHCGVYVGDPGVVATQRVTVANNKFGNVAFGVIVANPNHTPNLSLGTNACAGCVTPCSPAYLPKLKRKSGAE
jgi:hypothetical protein